MSVDHLRRMFVREVEALGSFDAAIEAEVIGGDPVMLERVRAIVPVRLGGTAAGVDAESTWRIALVREERATGCTVMELRELMRAAGVPLPDGL